MEEISQKIKDIGLEPDKLKGFSSEQIEKLASAENIGLIKSGGSVSEALNLKMPLDATVTVVNPDGSVIENFDANLAHAGDTVARNADGSITVFKTSDITVKEGQSLLGIYQQIESAISKENIPNEIRDVFNEGKGYWGEKITRSEANRILEWWHDNKNEFGKMSSEKQKEFLSGLKDAHSKDELNRLFNESLGKAEITKEAVVPVAEVVAPKTISSPMEEKNASPPEGWEAPFGLSKDHILNNSNIRASQRLAHIYETKAGPWEGGRIEEYEQIKNTKAVDLMSATDLISSTDGVEDHKEQLAAYLRYLKNNTGIQPNPTEAIDDYILRGERYFHDQSAAWNEAVSNPEIKMNDKNWDIIDDRTPKERIDPDAWSQEVKAGKMFERRGVTENVILDSQASVRNKITEIFHYKNNTALENIKEWSRVKTQQTSDVMNGEFETSGLWGSLRKFFGKSEFSVTNKNDLTIMGQHRTLRGYLNELHEKVPQVDPKGKNVETYLQETERILSMKKAAQGEFLRTQELK